MEDFTGKRVRIRTLEKLGSGCRLNGLTATVVAQHPIAPDWLKIELDPNSVTSHGETDDFSYNVISDPVHVHDIQATILRCLGIDHKRLTFKFQGRHFRLTDVAGEVVDKLLTV